MGVLAMCTQTLSMVRSHHYNRIVELFPGSEGRYQLSEHGIGIGYPSVIRIARGNLRINEMNPQKDWAIRRSAQPLDSTREDLGCFAVMDQL